MIRSAFIEEHGNGRMEVEMRDLLAELTERQIPVELFTAKRLQRRELPLSPETMVAGTIPVVLGALKQLKVEMPEPDDYPGCLTEFLHRKIWTSSVKNIRQRLLDDSSDPIFVKPKGRLKRFTGRVMQWMSDINHFEGASGVLPVYCSDVVKWLSEWRIFVIDGEIVGIRHYDGNEEIAIDRGALRTLSGFLRHLVVPIVHTPLILAYWKADRLPW